MLYKLILYLLKADHVARAGLPAELPVGLQLPVGVGHPGQVLAQGNGRTKDQDQSEKRFLHSWPRHRDTRSLFKQ